MTDEERQAELAAMTVKGKGENLTDLANSLGIDTNGLNKAPLIDAIMEAEMQPTPKPKPKKAKPATAKVKQPEPESDIVLDLDNERAGLAKEADHLAELIDRAEAQAAAEITSARNLMKNAERCATETLNAEVVAEMRGYVASATRKFK